MEGTAVKKQEQTTTKQLVMRKIYVNKLHANIIHTGEYMMYMNLKHLHYSFKGVLEVC